MFFQSKFSPPLSSQDVYVPRRANDEKSAALTYSNTSLDTDTESRSNRGPHRLSNQQAHGLYVEAANDPIPQRGTEKRRIYDQFIRSDERPDSTNLKAFRAAVVPKIKECSDRIYAQRIYDQKVCETRRITAGNIYDAEKEVHGYGEKFAELEDKISGASMRTIREKNPQRDACNEEPPLVLTMAREECRQRLHESRKRMRTVKHSNARELSKLLIQNPNVNSKAEYSKRQKYKKSLCNAQESYSMELQMWVIRREEYYVKHGSRLSESFNMMSMS